MFDVVSFVIVRSVRLQCHDADDDDGDDGIYNWLPKSYYLWDHRLELVVDTQPSVHENRIYMRTVCHALLSLYFCHSNTWTQ